MARPATPAWCDKNKRMNLYGKFQNPSSTLRGSSKIQAPKCGGAAGNSVSHESRVTPPSRFNDSTIQRAQSAFTMIEIAISLAVIAFALVAIIGILPTGMQVQKDNRQETIVNLDATIFLNAIRNGALGVDDLTNYVYAITNYST